MLCRFSVDNVNTKLHKTKNGKSDNLNNFYIDLTHKCYITTHILNFIMKLQQELLRKKRHNIIRERLRCGFQNLMTGPFDPVSNSNETEWISFITTD